MANENSATPAADGETTKQNDQPQAAADQQPDSTESGEASSPSRPATNARKADFEKDIVYLYQFSRGPLSPSVSSYCLKVETWLRITNTKYENIDHKLKYKSSKGQLPFIELNGEETADSDFIIRRLSDYFQHDLDSVLTAEQRTISHAFCVMLDQFTVWAVKWWRFTNPGDFLRGTKLNLRNMVNSCLPPAVLNLVFKLRFRSKLSTTKAQGIGVHSPQEILELASLDLKSLSDYLSDKHYFFGDQPSVLDCVAFSHLAQILCVEDVEFALKNFVQEKCPNLVAFFDRIKEQFWPDWTEMGQTLDLNTHLPKKAAAEPVSEEKAEKETGDDKTRESDGENEKDEKETETKDKKIEEEDENKRVEESKNEP